MSKEVEIKNLEQRKTRERDSEKEALRCLSNKYIELSSIDNLSRDLFENSYRLYINPTEELNMGSIVKSDKPVLTVLASGDFALEAAFHGAKEIVTFDINRLQWYPASLKLTGLQNMDYNDYWNFFSDASHDNYLSPKQYERLKRTAKNNPLLFSFFNVLMDRRMMDQKKFKKYIRDHKEYEIIVDLINDLSSKDEEKRKKAQQVFNFMGTNIDFKPSEIEYDMLLHMFDPSYETSRFLKCLVGLGGTKVKDSYIESEESFNKTKELIKNVDIKFVKSDLSKLRTALERTGYLKNPNFQGFQSIYLSNIPEYISGDKFEEIVENELMPLLEDGGIIAYCCQGTSRKSLQLTSEEINNLKKTANLKNDTVGKSIFSDIHKINNIEGYLLLKDKYPIEIIDAKKLSVTNGADDKGMFIYIKKDNK